MPGGGRSVAGMAFSRAKLVGAGLDAATRPRKIWHEIVAEKPTFPYLIPLLLLAWWIERFIVSFSNWVPLLAAVWATLQYGKYQHKLAVEKLNNKWHQHMLYNSAATPVESCEWLNKLLLTVWPNYIEPMMVGRLVANVQKIIKEKKPKSIHAIEVQEFSLGSSPPELGLHRTYWATDNSGMTSMYAGFKWDTNEMSIMLAAKLAGPFKGKVVRILINSIYVRGQVRIMPVLDGQGVLYAFDEVPEVKLGMEVGAANQMLPFTELPFIASWLEMLLKEILMRTMVEPRRRLIPLSAINLKKKAVAGMLVVTIVSAKNLRQSSLQRSLDRDNEMFMRMAVNGTQTAPEGMFVELSSGHLTRKTKVVRQSDNPVWEEPIDMVLHDDSGILHLHAYRQGSGNIKADFFGSCQINVKYVDDDSTIFWAVGPNNSAIAVRSEFCGKDVAMTIPLEHIPSAEITVRLSLKEWQFDDGSRAVANFIPSLSAREGAQPLLGVMSRLQPMTGRTILVTAVEGRNLAPIGKTGKSNPYVKLTYGRTVRKTKIVNQDLNPGWNQNFIFKEVAGGEYLKIKCYDSDKFGEQSIGSALVNLQGIAEDVVRDVWIPLEKIKTGEIHLKIEILGVGQEHSKSVAHVPKEPTPQEEEGVSAFLELVLIEAKNLIAANWGGTSDPYVSVRYGQIKKRTKVVYRTVNPVWNNSMSFVEDGRGSMILHVKDYNTILMPTTIGHCEVDLDGLEPNKTVDQWLPLKGVDKGELHIRITRKVASKSKKEMVMPMVKTQEQQNPGKIRLHKSSAQVRKLIRKALSMIDEDGENEEMKILMEELETTEDERDAMIEQLQRDRDALVAKATELEKVMSGLP